MSVISGIAGSVTFASGYTTDVKAWSAVKSAQVQPKRVLNPSGGWQLGYKGCPVMSMRGKYVCEIEAPCDALASIITNPSGWSVVSECETSPYLVLGSQWMNHSVGYKTASYEVMGFIDGTTPAPEAGDMVTATLQQSAGNTYVFTDSVITGVDLANGDGERAIRVGGVMTQAVGGNLPVAGVNGAATFVAGAESYAVTIIVTKTTYTVDRSGEVPKGMLEVEFVVNGVPA